MTQLIESQPSGHPMICQPLQYPPIFFDPIPQSISFSAPQTSYESQSSTSSTTQPLRSPRQSLIADDFNLGSTQSTSSQSKRPEMIPESQRLRTMSEIQILETQYRVLRERQQQTPQLVTAEQPITLKCQFSKSSTVTGFGFQSIGRIPSKIDD